MATHDCLNHSPVLKPHITATGRPERCWAVRKSNWNHIRSTVKTSSASEVPWIHFSHLLETPTNNLFYYGSILEQQMRTTKPPPLAGLSAYCQKDCIPARLSFRMEQKPNPRGHSDAHFHHFISEFFLCSSSNPRSVLLRQTWEGRMWFPPPAPTPWLLRFIALSVLPCGLLCTHFHSPEVKCIWHHIK